ncbi:hypothetical protein [Streptomyces kaempferi]|uniref:Uncharacterized protein n=1 Tax=Streptomyces kaempferi TaxID=333725 RepID=A0ABW3XWG2_9ACTN
MNGDYIHQVGDGNAGKVVHSGTGDIVIGDRTGDRPKVVNAVIEEIKALRQHLDARDQEVVDASVEELASNPSPGRMRILLQQVAGIAAVVGEVGAPVISAIKAVMGSL